MKPCFGLFLAIFLSLTLQPCAMSRDAMENGITSYQQQKYQLARKYFLSATTANPNSAAAHYQLANTLVHLGEHRLAQQHYRLTSLLDPNGTYGRFAAEAMAGYNGAPARSTYASASDTQISTTSFGRPYSEERSMLYQHGVWQKDDGSGAINLNLPPHTNSHVGGHPSIPGNHRGFGYDYSNPGGYNYPRSSSGYGLSNGYSSVPVYSNRNASSHHRDSHHDDHHD